MKKKIVSTLLVTALAMTTATGFTVSAAEMTDPVLKDGEMTELVISWSGSTAAPEHLEEVQNAFNELISDKVDATVKFQIVEWGSYDDQINLMLSSGEKLDLFFSTDNIKEKAKRGQLYPITDLVDTYAKEAYDLMKPYMEACYFDGELYGFPSYRDMASQKGLVCRADLLEEMGFNAEEIITMDDVEKVLMKVQENYPDMYPLLPFTLNEGCFMNYTGGEFDIISSGVGCDMDDDVADGVTIINTYASEKYKEMAEKAYEWNQKGYFMPDATTNTSTVESLLAADKGFGYYGNVHPGVVTQVSSNCGKEIVTIPIGRRIATTEYTNFIEWLIPSQCENPEKALAVLNLIYSDPEVQNLLHFGIEGLDYEIKDAENGVVGYPEGVSAENVGWRFDAWMTGNSSIGYVWETDPVDLYDKYEEFNTTAEYSPLYGFIYDTSNVRNEITAITNVCEKYKAVIENGDTDPEISVDAFNKELTAAGIDNVIADMQTQVDAWLAEK